MHIALQKTFAGHSRDVNSVAFSPDGDVLVSGGGDRSVRLWSMSKRQVLHTMEHGEWVNSVAYCPTGPSLVSAGKGGVVKLWAAINGKLLGSIHAHPQNATSVTFSPDGSWIISGGSDGTVRFFNLSHKRMEASITAHDGWVWKVAVSKNGTRLVTGGGDGFARIWRLGGNERPLSLAGHSGEVLYATFSHDGDRVATSGKDGTIRLWDADTGAQILTIQAHTGAANAVNFSPDGASLISAGTDDSVKLWNSSDGTFVREIDHCYDYAAEAIFSLDGKLMASCGGDGTVKLWSVSDQDAAEGGLIATELTGIERTESGNGGYSPAYASGKVLATGALSTGRKVSLMVTTAGNHIFCTGDRQSAIIAISGDSLSVINGDGIPVFDYDLESGSIVRDSSGGAAMPYVDETPAEPVVSAPVVEPAVQPAKSGELVIERLGDLAASRYATYDKHGEVLASAETLAGRRLKFIKFDADTLYVVFGTADQPTIVIKNDYLDVRNKSGIPLFRISLQSLRPVISRRRSGVDDGLGESGGSQRDSLLVTSAGDWIKGSGLPPIQMILSSAIRSQASDVHIPSGSRILMRRHGVLTPMSQTEYSPADVEIMLIEILTEEQRKRFVETNDLDFSYEVPGVSRFRANLCRQHRGVDGTFRVIPETIPDHETLGLPASVPPLIKHHQGLILITGSAGQGKSTTIACLVDMINSERPLHIITVEDPIEFVHPLKKAVVNQREVGKHTLKYANALRAALREDPDVIVVGEMRDLETISLAITAAETGHLVLGTLMTTNASQTVDRILDSFPPGQQAQIRTMLSESLRGIVSQQLVPAADGNGRVLACEVLLCNLAVGNMIREKKTFQLNSIMQTGRSHGMQRMDDALFDMVQVNKIAPATALAYASDRKAMEMKVKPKAAPEPPLKGK